MKTFVTALVLIFALASGASIIALTGHDRVQMTQNNAHTAGHQKTALVY
jgi:hypothetical protein